MNHCSFLGKLKKTTYTCEDIERIEIVLQIENKRKGKNIAKKMDYEYLTFEAWGTAAISINKNLKLNDYMLIIDSTARNDNGNVYFRINDFKIIKKEN